jgi:hypothetical protein
MADFRLVVGKLGHCVPNAKAPDGTTQVPFPLDASFNWSASDPNVQFSDPASASPDITGIAPATGVIITMDVDENGFHHTATHTVDVLPSPSVDTIGSVDFTIQ